MHPTLAAPARIPLMLGVLLAVAACADQSTPTAPAAPPASSLGVNNGGNNRRILFASTRDEIGNMEIYSMNPDGSGLDRLTQSAGFDVQVRSERTPHSLRDSAFGFRTSYLVKGWDLAAFYYGSVDANTTFFRSSEIRTIGTQPMCISTGSIFIRLRSSRHN